MYVCTGGGEEVQTSTVYVIYGGELGLKKEVFTFPLNGKKFQIGPVMEPFLLFLLRMGTVRLLPLRRMNWEYH